MLGCPGQEDSTRLQVQGSRLMAAKAAGLAAGWTDTQAES